MKFRSLQILRCVAANLVVVSHIVSIEGKYSDGYAILPRWLDLLAGQVGVHWFFILSGFVMALVVGLGDWTVFLRDRVARIFPIYWFYTTIVLLISLALPSIVNTSFTHEPSILKSYLLWPDIQPPILAVGWTLIHEMYFYVVLTAMIAFKIRLPVGLMAWALVVFTMSWLWNPQPDEPVGRVLTNPMTYEFIAGAFVGLAVKNWGARYGEAFLASGVALFICGCSWLWFTGIAHPPLTDLILLLGLPFLLIVYGAAGLEINNKLPNWTLIERMGDASYSTYLSHVLVVSALGRVFLWQPVHGWAAECLFVVTCLVAANIFGYISYRLIELPMIDGFRNAISSTRSNLRTAN